MEMHSLIAAVVAASLINTRFLLFSNFSKFQTSTKKNQDNKSVTDRGGLGLFVMSCHGYRFLFTFSRHVFFNERQSRNLRYYSVE